MLVTEEEEFVGAGFEELGDVGVHGDFLFFACVVDVFLLGVLEGGVLVGEGAFVAHDGVIGLEDAGVEGALSVLGSDVLDDGEAEGEFLDVLDFLGVFAFLVFGSDPESSGIELCSDVHLILELVALGGEVGDLGVCHTDLFLDLGVLFVERLVDAVEGIDLHDVAAEDFAERGDFGFESFDFCCVGGFGAFKFLE